MNDLATLDTKSEPLRVGILGAARLSEPAVVKPATVVPGMSRRLIGLIDECYEAIGMQPRPNAEQR